ncbi:LOW QUALITY PROTEIN: hypothetical protein Cgig2_024764 [Carnegiea gigantea]|uniref:Aminotransferase-like plant mobile domain-containing protein n=1 Tax=Carnegiea gigantea TaxID=171969 RepID=A0A9Q1JYZ1_9CARY|nr:LOW QUALITY PROTEIN: hypothetical protein Cgig2_024764 [Carnegiea gigantea]
MGEASILGGVFLCASVFGMDVLTHCRDLLVANHLFDALYASLFIFDKCPNTMRSICKYWCPETSPLHTLKGEVSISLLDTHGFLGLPLSGFLYHEVVSPSKELKTSLGRSCTHLFIAYHILRQRFDHKPTIEEWIAFWFHGPVKYHSPMKSDRQSRVPLPINISLTIEVHGWNKSHSIFDELGMPKGEHTETFLATFLSCWLCMFILLHRTRKRPSILSFFGHPRRHLQRSWQNCCSADPGRKGGHIQWHFLYAWVAKYFQTYDFNDNVSSNLGMPKFSGFGRAKIFDLDKARELISFGKGFCWNSTIRHRMKEILIDNGQLHSKRRRDSSSDQNIQRDEGASGSKPKLKIVHSQKPLRSPILEIEDNTPQTKILGVSAAISVTPISAIHIHSVAMLVKAPDELKSIAVYTPDEQGTPNVQGSKLNYGKTIFPHPDGAKNIIDILDCNPRPTKCMGESKILILRRGWHMFLCHQEVTDFFGNDLCLNGSKSICTPNDDDEARSTPKADASQVPPPLRPSRALQDVPVFNVDALIREVHKSRDRMTGQVILDKMFRTPFERLHYVKDEFDGLYNLTNEREGDATPLKDKFKRLIH